MVAVAVADIVASLELIANYNKSSTFICSQGPVKITSTLTLTKTTAGAAHLARIPSADKVNGDSLEKHTKNNSKLTKTPLSGGASSLS